MRKAEWIKHLLKMELEDGVEIPRIHIKSQVEWWPKTVIPAFGRWSRDAFGKLANQTSQSRNYRVSENGASDRGRHLCSIPGLHRHTHTMHMNLHRHLYLRTRQPAYEHTCTLHTPSQTLYPHIREHVYAYHTCTLHTPSQTLVPI